MLLINERRLSCAARRAAFRMMEYACSASSKRMSKPLYPESRTKAAKDCSINLASWRLIILLMPYFFW